MADRAADLATSTALLLDGFGRIAEGVPHVVDGLTPEELLWRPDADANHIAWLVWHLARQQDEQLAALGHVRSVWRSTAIADQFGLAYERRAHGYGMSSEQVGAFTLTDPALLVDYHAQVHTITRTVLEGLGQDDYAEVIDEAWDPPVTVAVRLISVLEDAAKHLGQAEYVRGLVRRRRH